MARACFIQAMERGECRDTQALSLCARCSFWTPLPSQRAFPEPTRSVRQAVTVVYEVNRQARRVLIALSGFARKSRKSGKLKQFSGN
jgi:hypothetical protein